MTIDCPLTCYICGKTPEDAKTVDLLGCLKNREEARERFKEKHEKNPDGYLFICSSCREKNPVYTKNVEEKYGVVTSP